MDENNDDFEAKKKKAQEAPSDWAMVAVVAMVCLTTCFCIYTILGK